MTVEQVRSEDSVRLVPVTAFPVGFEVDDYERVVEVISEPSGLHAWIAVHNTKFGPGLGGCRAWVYQSSTDALTDVLRLSRAMTLKARAAELPLGGGKSVIQLEPGQKLTPDMLHDFGRAIDQLGGSYVVAEDVGTSESAMVEISQTTEHVTGLPGDRGGKGDPGAFTARGVFLSMKATWAHLSGVDRLAGVRCAIQGLGHVGAGLTELLAEAGAKLYASDLDVARVDWAREQHAVQPVAREDLLALDCDVLCPCAMGGVLNDATVAQLRCRAVVGAANNQLAEPEVAATLQERDIAYVPDFVANVGGLINVAGEILDFSGDDISRQIEAIGPRVATLLKESEERGVSPDIIAREQAEQALLE